ncbi:pentapeptide repeat-containing protein [Deltaproteobacteria bacterium TL4]
MKTILDRLKWSFILLLLFQPHASVAFNPMHLEQLRQTGSCEACDLSGFEFRRAELQGVQLRRTDLRKARFTHANLEGADFEGADLSGTELKGANLKRANLAHTNLNGVNLSGANLEEARLNAASLKKTLLHAANLRWAQLENADMQGAELEAADIQNANFQGSNLSKSKWRGLSTYHANLSHVNFSEATLVETSFERVNLSETAWSHAEIRWSHFDQVDLTGSNFSKASIKYSSLTDSQLNQTRFNKTQMIRVDLEGSSLINADFEEATLQRINFKGTTLSQSNFQRALIQNSAFQGAILKQANFKETRLDDSDFQSALLPQASFQKARLSWINLRKTDLRKVDFYQAQLKSVQFQGSRLEEARWIDGGNTNQLQKEVFLPRLLELMKDGISLILTPLSRGLIDDPFRFLMGVFFVIAGLYLTRVIRRRKSQNTLRHIGWVIASIGVTLITTTPTVGHLFEFPVIFEFLGMASLCFIFGSCCSLIDQVFGATSHQKLLKVWWVYLGGVVFFFMLLLVFSSIYPQSPVIQYGIAFPGLVLLGVMSLIFLFVPIKTIIQGIISGNPDARILFYFALVAILHSLPFMLSHFNVISFPQWVSNVALLGLVLFLSSFGVIALRRYIEVHRRLECHSMELEEKNDQLNHKNDELSHANRLKDEFLANTSHELRTPLNGIIGIGESMMEGATGPLTEVQIVNLAMITASGRRLTHLVNDLLDFSKLKHRKIELSLKPVGIREVTEVVMLLSKPLIGTKNLKLINAVGSELPPVDADENRLQQIMQNMIANAIKFTDQGTVTVSAEIIEPYLKIEVTDTGIGIPKGQLNRIFESFEQGDGSTSRKYGGTGLGLSITKQLVELHGGNIRVISEEGQGSTFLITLPLSKEPLHKEGCVLDTILSKLKALHPANSFEDSSKKKDPALIEAPPQLTLQTELPPELKSTLVPSTVQSRFQGSLALPQESSKKIKILIVDDEPVNLQVLINYLSLHHYTITQANDGLKALELIEKDPDFDLILLDVMMPRMTGYEVCSRLRKQYATYELPVLLLTAKNQTVDVIEGFNAGANDYLTKPFSKQELLARIKIHLELSKTNLAYGRFVPMEFLQLLGKRSIVDVNLGDQVQKNMSILFSDIRSFTSLSEQMTPAENFQFINEYLSYMEPIVIQHRGFVDKYIGDAIMALFDHNADDAVKASVDMLKELQNYNNHRNLLGKPSIQIGIGINTGSLMLGTIGGNNRMDGTVISDAVNLASRIEGMTKNYGASILISEYTFYQLKAPHTFSTRIVDRVQVKGKKDPVSVFEILDGEPPHQRELKKATASVFEQGLALYHLQEFDAAKSLFVGCQHKNPDDRALQLYIQRCEQYATRNPHEPWDGITRLDSK